MPPIIVYPALPKGATVALGGCTLRAIAVIVIVAVAVVPAESLTVTVTDPAAVPAGTVAVNVPSAAIADNVIARLLEVTVYGAIPPNIVNGIISAGAAPFTVTASG